MAFLRLFLLLITVAGSSPVQAAGHDDQCTMDASAIYTPPECHSHNSDATPPSGSSTEDFNATHRSSSSSSSSTSSAPSPTSPHPHPPPPPCGPTPVCSKLLCCCANLEYVATEFYCQAALGKTTNDLDSSIAGNGTDLPRGGQKAPLSASTQDILSQIAYESVHHLRAIQTTLGTKACNRPGIDVSKSTFGRVVNYATGEIQWPGFDWYHGDHHTLLGAYWFSGLLTKCYIGILDRCEGGPSTKRLCGSLAAAKARHETAIRTVLYQSLKTQVYPYKYTVADMTNKLSAYADDLVASNMTCNGTAFEGLWVPSCLGCGGGNGNLFSSGSYSLPYSSNVDDNCTVIKNVLGDMAYDYK